MKPFAAGKWIDPVDDVFRGRSGCLGLHFRSQVDLIYEDHTDTRLCGRPQFVFEPLWERSVLIVGTESLVVLTLSTSLSHRRQRTLITQIPRPGRFAGAFGPVLLPK